jgi:hypothetical protein
MISKIILIFLISLFGFGPTILLIISELSPKSKWFCEKLGWHRDRDVERTDDDGCSEHGRCTRCSEDVMRDGNGNWF